ncbi:MAG TPA: isocitrate/isopropylmalate dehydrogenase family protein [Thermoanaerobaculia bacterium]|nr:isocitrate/isopropylmalate dehydrogenase family protein [Thermoanaerobaculia bacterium]
MRRLLRLAVIPGDGIGTELLPAALEAFDALGIHYEAKLLEAGWEAFEKHGDALPGATLEAARDADAVVFGAVSSPSHSVAGYRSPIVALRRELDLYANLRPAVSAPVPGSRPGVDLLIVRENTEGLYSGREREEGDGAVAERVVTRRASLRIARRAFEQARRRRSLGRPGRVTIVHKANVLRLTDGIFRACALEAAREFAEIEVEEQLVDSMASRLIREPGRFDVVVATNLFGDILSDVAAALVGGLGLAASANVGDRPLLVEPVHGSAPDLAGKGMANPIATLRALALLLAHGGRDAEAERLERALDEALRSGPRTPDLGGTATTAEVLAAVCAELRRGAPAEAAGPAR